MGDYYSKKGDKFCCSNCDFKTEKRLGILTHIRTHKKIVEAKRTNQQKVLFNTTKVCLTLTELEEYFLHFWNCGKEDTSKDWIKDHIRSELNGIPPKPEDLGILPTII